MQVNTIRCTTLHDGCKVVTSYLSLVACTTAVIQPLGAPAVVRLHARPHNSTVMLLLHVQAIGDETNTIGLDGLAERCAKYYKQGIFQKQDAH